LDGEPGSPVPLALFLSRLCEEFHCVPSVALREWLHAPCGLIEDVLEARAYQATKAAVDRADLSGGKVSYPDGPLVDVVQQIEAQQALKAM
jgi:hypothetical protein